MPDHVGRTGFALLKWFWPFAVWLSHPGNLLIFVSVGLALTQWAYTVWKWRQESKRKVQG